MLVVSLFPGIGLLDKGFEGAGFCVVRGPDIIWGGDIRSFNPPAGKFDGVIGGPPCQDFSKKRRDPPTGYGKEMLSEFTRVVLAARPTWWLLENVPGVPDVKIDGYSWQRIDLYAHEFGLKQRRLRHVQFGHVDGWPLIIEREKAQHTRLEPTCLASETDRDWDRFCALQGIIPALHLPYFTRSASYRAVGNGVPLPMARAVANAIKGMPYTGVTPCACGCGRPVTGAATYAGAACRKRAQRRRDGAGVTVPGKVTAGGSQ